MARETSRLLALPWADAKHRVECSLLLPGLCPQAAVGLQSFCTSAIREGHCSLLNPREAWGRARKPQIITENLRDLCSTILSNEELGVVLLCYIVGRWGERNLHARMMSPEPQMDVKLGFAFILIKVRNSQVCWCLICWCLEAAIGMQMSIRLLIKSCIALRYVN